MKLLSRTEIKKKETDDKSYAHKIDAEISTLVQSLNDTRFRVEKEKKEIINDLAKFAQKYADIKSSMTVESLSKESRRKVSSQVLSDLYEESEQKLEKSKTEKKDAERMMSDAEHALTEAKKTKSIAEEMVKTANEISLQNSSKSLELEDREKKVVKVESETASAKKEFEQYRDKCQIEIDAEFKEISLLRKSLDSLKSELDNKIKENEKEMETFQIQSKDERATLDAAWRELRSAQLANKH